MPPRLLQTGSQWRAFLGAPSNRAASLHTHARAAPYPRRPLSHPANAFITSRKGAIALLSTLVACSFSGKPGAPEPLPTAHRAPLLALPPRTVLRRVHTSSRRAQQSPPIVDSTPAQHHVELDRVTLATPARSTFEFLSRYHGARAAAKTRRTGAGTASLPNAPPNAPRPWRPDQPGAPSLVDPDRAFTPEGILQQQHHEQTKSTLASAVNGARLSSLSSKTASTSALPQASQTSGDMGAGRQIGDSSYMSDSSVGSSRGATGGGAGGGQSGDRIHDLIRHPALYDPIRAPRFPIVLCHGLYGFDVRGPFLGLEIHYWAAVLDILRKKIGAEVIIRGVPGTGSIQKRAEALHQYLASPEAGVEGKKLNFIGHSMGGLDVRHLITNIRPTEYTPVSLTTISTPHRGSPFMDWCNANIGVGNDTIEQAIAAASQPGQSSSSSEPTRVPYSLKSPLFSRPAKTAANAAKDKDIGDGGAVQKSSEPESSTSPSSSVTGSQAQAHVGPSSESEGSAASKARSKQDKAEMQAQLKGKIKNATGGNPFGFSSLVSGLSGVSGAFSSYMLSLLDQPAYAMLSTKYMRDVFNPQTPDVPNVRYFSVAARTRRLSIWHPLWLPKLILDAAAESRTSGAESDGSGEALGSHLQGNDGLVAVQSARWGEFLGIMEGCDHWDLRGGGAPRFASKVNPATGKPYAESQQPKPKEKPTSEKSGWGWADVNRLLGNWGSSKSKSKDSRRSTPEPNTPALVASSSPHELPSNASTTLQGNFSTSTSTQTTTQSNLRAGARATETDQSDASALAFLDHYAQLTAADGADGVDLNRVRDRRAEEARPSGDRASVQEAGRSDAALYAGSKGKEEASGAAVFAKDIASWISDRLPQRDDERRLQAEAQADEQDRHDRELRISLAGLQSLDPDAPVMSPQDVSDDARRQIADTYYEGSDIAAEHGQPAAPEDEQSSSEGLLTYGSLPTWEDLATPEAAAMAATDAELGDSAGILPSSPAVSENSPKRADQPESPQSKLRRDAEWQRVLRERIGGDVADRELRREMAWHRAHHLGSTSATRPNPLGSSTFTSFAFTSASEEAATRHFRRPSLPGEREFDWDAHARKRPRSQWESRAQREKETDVSDLERFWVALCRHLWLEGY